MEPGVELVNWNGDLLFPLRDGEGEDLLVGYLGVQNANDGLVEDTEVLHAHWLSAGGAPDRPAGRDGHRWSLRRRG